MRDTLIFGQAYQGGARAGSGGRRRGAVGRRGNLRLQRRLQGRDHPGDHRQGPDHARRRPRADQGVVVLRAMHLEGRGAAQASTLGDAMRPAAASRCASASTSRIEEVRGFILSKELKSVPAVMQELGWKTSCGCPSCRPALNYYLLCAWPGEYRDDAQSRFVNERVHANIQKDGTFSIVPRMWGGVTTPDELRAIADVADRFNDQDRQGDRRPAHRPARLQERGPAGGVGAAQRRGTRLRPGLRQGPAHGEDLRRQRMVPVRHPGLRPGSASSSSASCAARGRRPR